MKNVITYSKKAYHLGLFTDLSEISEFLKNRTWLVSCSSHTMHRFVNVLPGKLNSSLIIQYFSFSDWITIIFIYIYIYTKIIVI